MSIAVAIQHFYDRFHRNGLYKTAVQRTAEMPGKIGLEVEAALNRVAASQEAKYADAAEATVGSAKMSAVRNLGLEKGEGAVLESRLAGQGRLLALAVDLPGELAVGLERQRDRQVRRRSSRLGRNRERSCRSARRLAGRAVKLTFVDSDGRFEEARSWMDFALETKRSPSTVCARRRA